MSGLTGNNILAGSSGQGGYEIEQSLRFEDGDSPALSLTPSTSNRKTFTWSGWIKRGNIPASYMNLFGATDGVNNEFDIRFTSSNTLEVNEYTSPSYNFDVITSQVFRDTSSWYHIVVVVDTTESTASDRVKIYINGSQVTSFGTASYPSLNYDTYINNSSYPTYIGSFSTTGNRFDGYLAEVNFIDGQALDPSNFGETDLLTNQWIPKKYVGTYGTNGFYLNFSDSASLGADSSGNGNNFTPTNLAATDQVLDSPTNNFATLNPLGLFYDNGSSAVLQEGNLKFVASVTNGKVQSSIGVRSGKWYAEAIIADTIYPGVVGIISNAGTTDEVNSSKIRVNNTVIQKDGVTVQSGLSGLSPGDIIGIAYDADTRAVQFYKNNSAYGTSETMTSTNFFNYFYLANGTVNDKVIYFNFGQDSSFAGTKTAQNNTDGNGKGDFYYAPPSGYLALCEDNLPDPSIALPGDHFNTVLYSGDGSASNSITGVGFQPDLSWIKTRNDTQWHMLNDVVRGVNKSINSNATNAEFTDTDRFLSFDVDGFTVGADGSVNGSGDTLVSWNWKADNTSGSSNTDGTITSTVSANTTAGFSIVSFTGTGSGSATIGHGLSSAPEFITVKRRATTSNWDSYIGPVGNNGGMSLNGASAFAVSSAYFNNTSPTASVFTIGSGLNAAVTCIAYCFHSVEGYSKIGSYTGNGSTNGTFVYTGFRPAFVIVKRTNNVGSWVMYDGTRDQYNVVGKYLLANYANAEVNGGARFDFLSNGIKLRTTETGHNNSGDTFFYMAFAESPFKYSTAR